MVDDYVFCTCVIWSVYNWYTTVYAPINVLFIPSGIGGVVQGKLDWHTPFDSKVFYSNWGRPFGWGFDNLIVLNSKLTTPRSEDGEAMYW